MLGLPYSVRWRIRPVVMTFQMHIDWGHRVGLVLVKLMTETLIHLVFPPVYQYYHLCHGHIET